MSPEPPPPPTPSPPPSPSVAPPPPPADPYGYGYPYPGPMSPMAFAVVRPSRPGIVTAIGVTSIVVASLSLIGTLWTAGSLLWLSTVASYAGALGGGTPGGPFGPGPAPAVPSATTAPVVEGARSVVVESGGLDSGARAAVAEGLSQLQFLTSPRLEQLDVLLAKSGRDIFPTLGTAPSAGAVESAILGHGTSLSADPGAPGSDYFRTRAGRFELHDDRAAFYPTRGEIVRVSTLTTSNPGLNPAQVQAVVRQAQASSGNTLNASQSAALNNLLGAQGQQLVSPLTVPTAIRGVTPLGGDGSVMIQFPNGFATIGPQGQTSSSTGSAAAAAGAAMPFARVRLSGAGLALAWFATLVGGALAVYLFVIGILVLRQSPRGRTLHRLYALVKIPVAILGAAAAWWLTLSYAEALLAAAGPANPLAAVSGGAADTIGTQQVVFGVLGLIYPIALLIVLQTRAVKDYYDTALV